MKSNTVIIPNISFGIKKTVGVMWDSANSSPTLTRLTPQNDPNQYVNTAIPNEPTPQIGTAGGSSPFDNIAPWKDMKIFTANAAGDIGSEVPRPVTNTTDDLVVRIPAFWFKIVKSGSLVYYYITQAAKVGFKKHKGSDCYVGRYATTGSAAAPTTKSGLAQAVSATLTAFRSGAAGKGAKWWQYDFNTYSAISLLYLVEFASWDSQGKVGAGITAGTKSNSGLTDSLTYHTGRPAGTTDQVAVQYRNIENLWGNVRQWVDGYIANERAVYVCDSPSQFADSLTAAYVSTGVTLPSVSGVYITNMNNSDDENWLIPTAASGGSATTYIPDYLYTSTGLLALYVGGYYSFGTNAGLFYFSSNYAASFSITNLGSRLVIK